MRNLAKLFLYCIVLPIIPLWDFLIVILWAVFCLAIYPLFLFAVLACLCVGSSEDAFVVLNAWRIMANRYYRDTL